MHPGKQWEITHVPGPLSPPETQMTPLAPGLTLAQPLPLQSFGGKQEHERSLSLFPSLHNIGFQIDKLNQKELYLNRDITDWKKGMRIEPQGPV